MPDKFFTPCPFYSDTKRFLFNNSCFDENPLKKHKKFAFMGNITLNKGGGIMFKRCFLVGLVCTFFIGTAFADMQQNRAAFIQRLIDNDIFQKVEIPGDLPRLWVKPSFDSLDYDTKSKFVNVVYAYYVTENPKYNIVILYDSRTGKKVGTYSEKDGGLKLN